MPGSNKEQEEARVKKEMANIRQKFASNTALNGYQKKKYVWKLVYMFMLGYDVDFGHMEVRFPPPRQRFGCSAVLTATCFCACSASI